MNDDVRTLRWGVLGTARIAKDYVIPAIKAVDGCDVVAIASRDGRRAAQAATEHSIDRAYSSYEELVEDTAVDCVYVPLPNSLHCAWTVHLLRAGKAVLCEKPLALNRLEADSMLAAATETGALLSEAFMYRYHEQFRALRAAVVSGDLGPIRTIRGSIGFSIGDGRNIRLDPELGGGALYDIGCYPLSAMCTLFEAAPTAARAFSYRRSGVDVVAAAVLEFPGERIGVMDCTFRQPWFQAPLEVIGDFGMVRLHDAYNPGQSPVRRFLVRRGERSRYEKLDGMNMYRAMIESFAASYLGDEPEYPFEISLHTATALDIVRAAMS
jgi:predicted dehydrogenase